MFGLLGKTCVILNWWTFKKQSVRCDVFNPRLLQTKHLMNDGSCNDRCNDRCYDVCDDLCDDLCDVLMTWCIVYDDICVFLYWWSLVNYFTVEIDVVFINQNCKHWLDLPKKKKISKVLEYVEWKYVLEKRKIRSFFKY
jgi:hypothetical protein